MSLTFQPPGDVQPVTSMHLQERTLKDVAISHAREEIGEATYDARNWQFFPGASGTISRVDLTIILSIKMPVWDNYRARPRQEMQEWDRFYRALLEHEKGYIQIIRREAQAMYAAMMQATPGTIQAVYDAGIEQISRLNAEYDSQTDHGRRQNTVHGSTMITI